KKKARDPVSRKRLRFLIVPPPARRRTDVTKIIVIGLAPIGQRDRMNETSEPIEDVEEALRDASVICPSWVLEAKGLDTIIRVDDQVSSVREFDRGDRLIGADAYHLEWKVAEDPLHLVHRAIDLLNIGRKRGEVDLCERPGRL